LKLVSVT